MWTCPSCMAMPVSSARELREARRGGARRRSLAARAEELNQHFARSPALFEDERELCLPPRRLLYEMCHWPSVDVVGRSTCMTGGGRRIAACVIFVGSHLALAMAEFQASASTEPALPLCRS